MKNITISLDTALEQFIAEKVAAGQFSSESEVVAGALEVLKEEESLTYADIEELRPHIQSGLAQLDRGEGRPWNVQEMLRDGRKMLTRRQRS